MSVQHANNFKTTLNGAINNSVTTITVTSVTGAPTVGSGSTAYFTISDGTNYEIVLASSLSTNTYTVTRGQQGTSALSWSSGASFFNACTAYDLDSFNTPNNVIINGINVGLGTSNISTNSAFGVSALNAITTGNHAVAFGYQAGILITSGNDNTCIGYLAGAKITTGAGNTNIGSQSGNQSTARQQTTMVGYKAGAACTSQDSAFGYQALMAGSGDAFGYNVLNASSGTGNCAFGNSSLSGASYSGTNTCAFGYNVLPSATSGSRNVAFGYQAGHNGTGGSASITTGTDNTLLGYQTGVNDATAVGVIAIGSGAVGEKNTGSTSSDHGPCPALGSSGNKVGFRGDGSIYPNTSGAGFFRLKINGTKYLIPLMADGSTNIGDSNNNISANNILAGYTSTATAAGTTTLTITSSQTQIFTGSTTQNCDMPAVSTLTLGTLYRIVNLSSGVVTVRSSGSNTIQAMQANSTLILVSNATSGTSASVWYVIDYTAAASDQTGSGSLVRATSPTLVTPVLGAATATSISFGDETLSTYDEGTWTPTFEGSTAAGTPTGTFNGRYVKIGKLCNISVQCVFTAITGMTGNLLMKNMPFASANSASARGGPNPSFKANFTTAGAIIMGFPTNNTTTFNFYRGEVNFTAIVIGDIAANTQLYFSLTYETT